MCPVSVPYLSIFSSQENAQAPTGSEARVGETRLDTRVHESSESQVSRKSCFHTFDLTRGNKQEYSTVGTREATAGLDPVPQVGPFHWKPGS